jgi:hypothetical protein
MFTKSTKSKKLIDAFCMFRVVADHSGEHVLLLTILNPLYPIDVNVLHSITHPHGKVVRIVIFHKNGVQAMVEYPLTVSMDYFLLFFFFFSFSPNRILSALVILP